MSKTTTRKGRKEPENTPQVLSTSTETFNVTNRCNTSHKEECYSKSLSHLGCGYNSRKRGSLSAKHNVFVIGIDGNPLTPTTNARARKLMEDGQARPVWNKFGIFGIKMLVKTRKEKTITVLGCDWGTKFEGYSVVSEKENNINVLWKLPVKRSIVRKLRERKQLRRARRFRNCRRRKTRFDNRKKDGFIAPSQLVIVRSRLKVIQELLICYPIKKVVIEDVKFSHKTKRWGRNFSTIEVGKKTIYNYIKKRLGKGGLKLVKGYYTFKLLKKYGLKKNRDKSKEDFYTHNIDSFLIASEMFKKEQKGFHQRITDKINEDLVIVDDTYRSTRRRLHDTQHSKGGIRERYSTGNFLGIRKGTICEFGQIVGGTKTYVYIRNWENKRIGKSLSKIRWLSHQFKTQFLSTPSDGIPLRCMVL